MANIRKALKALDSADGGVLPGRRENVGMLHGRERGALDRENMREIYQLTFTKALYKAHKTSATYSEADIIKEAEAWLDLVLASSPACVVCRQAKGDNAGQLLICGQCGVARYCSIDHQRLHWRPKASKKPASDFAYLESLKAALLEDPSRRPASRDTEADNDWIKTSTAYHLWSCVNCTRSGRVSKGCRRRAKRRRMRYLLILRRWKFPWKQMRRRSLQLEALRAQA